LKSIAQWCLSAGAIWPLLQQREQSIKINDRFFLGGPLNIRGFDYNGAGPHSEGEHHSITLFVESIDDTRTPAHCPRLFRVQVPPWEVIAIGRLAFTFTRHCRFSIIEKI
jgi:outer membrane protein assembly factor BamA